MKSPLMDMSLCSAANRIPLYPMPVLKTIGGSLRKLFLTMTSIGTEMESDLCTVKEKKLK